MRLKSSIILAIILTICSIHKFCFADICTSGTSSLINIPVARVIRHEQIAIGMSYVNSRVAYLENGLYNNFPIYANIGYLPRLELSAGVVFVPGKASYDGTSTYKDAVLSFQYLLLEEKPLFPAIAIGVRDIYSFILLNTSYVVASKTLLHKNLIAIYAHAGYGSDIVDEHQGVPKHDKKYPVGHTIVGSFAGFEMTFRNIGSIMVEYDSRKFNGGINIKLLPSLSAEVTLMRFSYLCGGLQFTFHL